VEPRPNAVDFLFHPAATYGHSASKPTRKISGCSTSASSFGWGKRTAKWKTNLQLVERRFIYHVCPLPNNPAATTFSHLLPRHVPLYLRRCGPSKPYQPKVQGLSTPQRQLIVLWSPTHRLLVARHHITTCMHSHEINGEIYYFTLCLDAFKIPKLYKIPNHIDSLFSSLQNSKTLQDFPSHRIFKHMHKILNVAK